MSLAMAKVGPKLARQANKTYPTTGDTHIRQWVRETADHFRRQ